MLPHPIAATVPQGAPREDEVPSATTTTTSASSEVVRHGWFPEGSLLDRADKAMSMIIFTMELGPVVELLLVVPGTFFGVPASSFGVFPLFLAWYAEHCVPGGDDASFAWLDEDLAALGFAPSDVSAAVVDKQAQNHPLRLALGSMGFGTRQSVAFALVALVPVLVYVAVFFRWLLTGRMVRVYSFTKYLLLPSLLLPVFIGKQLAPRGYRAGAFFVIAWIFAQMVGYTFKIAFGRQRPLAAPGTSKHLEHVVRAFPEMRELLGKGESAIESFPSGDTLGAAVFAAQLSIMGAPSWTFGIPFLTAFCRMYFHAHHVLDVAVGFLIGWFMTFGLADALHLWVAHPEGPMHAVDDYYFGLSIVAFVLFFMATRKLKRTLPNHLVVKGRKGF